MIKNAMLLPSLTMCLSIFDGCTVYYTTSEVSNLVAETEAAMRKEEQDFQSHQMAIASTTLSIQQLVNTLKK